jgi:membrane fusion protein (multidrug efflux system)
MLIMLGVVALVVLALAAAKGWSIYQQVQQFSQPQPAISVAAEPAVERPWQSRLPAIGTLKAFQGIDLTVEVGGIVRQVLFSSGEKVARDQPLLQMDSDVERAILATSEAERGLARVEFERGRSLVSRQSISKSAFDSLSAELQKANASVAQLQAQLAKKRILAPFAGTIGIRQVDLGDYLAPGATIATLQDLSKLYVDFFLPEQVVPQLSVGERVRFGVTAYPGEVFEGKIAAINPKVEETTRNVQVRAQLENPDAKLLPGMFANLEVLLPGENSRVVVPETAITYTLYGNSVYVIEAQEDSEGQLITAPQGQPQLAVQRRFVETGERRGGQVVIIEGLQAGERIVTAGQLKLDNGAHVTLAAAPANAASQPSTEQ